MCFSLPLKVIYRMRKDATRTFRIHVLIIALLACFAGLTCMHSATAQTSDIAVVVNINNPVANLSLGDLRKIFLGTKRTWPSGTSIKLLVRPPGCNERLALLRLLGMSEREYKQY
jgi:hypothetical protein